MTYDCFLFFNELELLELRLTELEEVVDRFVLVESPFTYAGKQKPLYFAESKGNFSRWADRIIHVIVDDMPDGPDPWMRERHQRKSIVRGLLGADLNDGIIISDVDEIPSAATVRSWSAAMGPRRFNQMFCYYWINCVGGYWAGSRILSFNQLKSYSDIETVRHLEFPIINQGGWHLSFLGGPSAIASKLEAYSHQELNLQQFKDQRYLACISSLGIDLFNRPGIRFKFLPLDENFPKAVQSKHSKYANLVRQVTFNEDIYPDSQLLCLYRLLLDICYLKGSVIEIGCREGKAAIALAHACFPETVYVVGRWRNELVDEISLIRNSSEDTGSVLSQFLTNIQLLTRGNVKIVQDNWRHFIESEESVKFVHIAEYDCESLGYLLGLLMPRMASGAIICGNHVPSPQRGRPDFKQQVEKVIQEEMPNVSYMNDLWVWRKDG